MRIRLCSEKAEVDNTGRKKISTEQGRLERVNRRKIAGRPFVDGGGKVGDGRRRSFEGAGLGGSLLLHTVLGERKKKHCLTTWDRREGKHSQEEEIK